MQQRSIQLGDDSSIWETAAQASAKAADAATLTRPEARRGQAPASFTFGSSAPEYSTTSSEATSAVASSKTIPRTAAAAKSSSVIVMGDDAVDYVTNRMSEEGSQTKTLKQRYVPKVPTLTSAR